MTMRDALVEALHLDDDANSVQRLHERGLAVANEDTMGKAIHDVYCGAEADHAEPNDKDRAQAKAILDALRREAMTL